MTSTLLEGLFSTGNLATLKPPQSPVQSAHEGAAFSMFARFFLLFLAVIIMGTAHAQTPLSRGPATPVVPGAATTPTQRVAAANDVVSSTLPVGSIPQAQAQAAGNFGPLARPESIGGQIQEAWSRPGKSRHSRPEFLW